MEAVVMYRSLFVSLQLQKLGVISFEDKLSGPTLLSYQELWGNNGDIISRQYAGTAAMKVTICILQYMTLRISVTT